MIGEVAGKVTEALVLHNSFVDLRVLLSHVAGTSLKDDGHDFAQSWFPLNAIVFIIGKTTFSPI